MGEYLALFSACCFAASNVTITRGARGRGMGEDNGAFLSILLTAAIGGLWWVGSAIVHGFPEIKWNGMLWFAMSGTLTIFIGRVFLYASIQYLGAVPASAVKRLSPVFSVVLGVLLLGESVDNAMAMGMLLIVVSFVVLMRESLKNAASAKAGEDGQSGATAGSSVRTSLLNLGYVYGPVSALAYSCGYVARKQGLMAIPDPAFGTMFGATVGAIVFVLMAQFVGSYRVALRQTFTRFNPWLFAAGVLGSAGQLFYFAALNSSTIARCAMLSSMEAIFTIFFTVLVSRSLKPLTGSVMVAAGLGVAGTVFIVLK